jgi:hypothetical protein
MPDALILLVLLIYSAAFIVLVGIAVSVWMSVISEIQERHARKHAMRRFDSEF